MAGIKKKLYIVEAYVQREDGGYRWLQSIPMDERAANSEKNRLVGLGYKVRCKQFMGGENGTVRPGGLS